MAKKISELDRYEEFTRVCRFIKCADEYECWQGEEKYIIISDRTKQDLEKKFPEIMTALSPYTLISKEMMKVIKCSRANDDKHFQRGVRSIDIENLYETVGNLYDAERHVWYTEIQDGLMTLSEKERKRILKCYLYGYSKQEIAACENAVEGAIRKSILSGAKKLKKYFEDKNP